MKYNYIIVGGGPCGISLSHLLAKTDKKILLLEGENSLGGCHRVDRVNGYFTEHSPRVYSTSYKNLELFLKDMGTTFHNLFTPYKFKISDIGKRNIMSLQKRELVLLVYHFFKLVMNSEYGSDISMKQFMINNNFKPDSINYIDRVCRVVDGATSEKFSLNEFLEIVNQQAFYPLYQPKQPNDVGFIKLWQDYLVKNKVDIKLNSKLTKIVPNENKIIIQNGDKEIEYQYDRLILALNPYIIQKITSNIFPEITPQYASRTRYLTYVSMSFHWKEKLKLPNIQGFSASEWGVVFIVMSDYFENYSGTLVSVAITILNEKSSELNKTANEISDITILQNEAFRQFTLSFVGTTIPKPDAITMYPGVSYVGKEPYGGWTSKNGSFFNSFENNNTFIPFQSPVYTNIYNLGCQNGYQTYKFTAIESAITNSIYLSKELEPNISVFKPKTGITLALVLQILLIIKLMFTLFVLYKAKMSYQLIIGFIIVIATLILYVNYNK